MIIFGHCYYCFPVESSSTSLVNSVSRDWGCGWTGPIESVPSSMISKSLHWPNIWKIWLQTEQIKLLLTRCLGFFFPRSWSCRTTEWSYFSLSSLSILLPFHLFIFFIGIKVLLFFHKFKRKTIESKITMNIPVLHLSILTLIKLIFLLQCPQIIH